jgi:enolase
MKIRGVNAKAIFDSRKEKTIFTSIDTDAGSFSASSPTGKSIGKYEAKPYKKSLEEDTETLKKFSDYFSGEIFERFDDLRRVEDILDRNVGANTIFALESAVLKAMAKEQKREIWQLINPRATKFPRLAGNCVGGGKHSHMKKKPDFQEFLLIPDVEGVKDASELNKKAKKEIIYELKTIDEEFNEKKNDEDAWETSLNEKAVLDILKDMKLPLGVDIAASSFHKRKSYTYLNPMLKRNAEEQLEYISNLIKNFNLFYIEDPFEEEDFESFAKLLKKFPNMLIVGDDLTVTNPKRLKKAIKLKSINALIVKPNQIGSLIQVGEVCELARKNNIKIIFSHRSGETDENILADLAFAFEADFLKCGITGKEREVKIKRLIDIENSLR